MIRLKMIPLLLALILVSMAGCKSKIALAPQAEEEGTQSDSNLVFSDDFNRSNEVLGSGGASSNWDGWLQYAMSGGATGLHLADIPIIGNELTALNGQTGYVSNYKHDKAIQEAYVSIDFKSDFHNVNMGVDGINGVDGGIAVLIDETNEEGFFCIVDGDGGTLIALVTYVTVNSDHIPGINNRLEINTNIPSDTSKTYNLGCEVTGKLADNNKKINMYIDNTKVLEYDMSGDAGLTTEKKDTGAVGTVIYKTNTTADNFKYYRVNPN